MNKLSMELFSFSGRDSSPQRHSALLQLLRDCLYNSSLKAGVSISIPQKLRKEGFFGSQNLFAYFLASSLCSSSDNLAGSNSSGITPTSSLSPYNSQILCVSFPALPPFVDGDTNSMVKVGTGPVGIGPSSGYDDF